MLIKAGSTSRMITVYAFDATTGLPYVTAAYSDFGISLWYRRGVNGAVTAITPATQTVTGAYSSGGFILLNAADNAYRLDVPDAAFAAGVDEVEIGGHATAWKLIGPTVQLVGADPRTEWTGDSFARIGAAGAGLTAVGDTAGTTTLLSRLTSARAGYLDNLSAGAVALQSTLTTLATSVAALPAAVWDRLTTALTTSGSIGAWILANAGSGASPATFWAYASRTLTQGAASVATAVTGSAVTTYRGTRWSVSLTGLPSYSTTTYTSIIVAVKRSTEDTDADSIVYIRKNRTGSPADGLIYFDGITSPTAAHASITADSATAITIVVEGAATQYATPGQYQYGVKILDASGYPVAESEGGSWIIAGETPRAVT